MIRTISSSRASFRCLLALAILCTLPLLMAGCTAKAFKIYPAQEIDFASLATEMGDLGRLARLDDPAYRTVQYSSFDRRSVAPDAEGWYSNSDGFGREPIPGFAKVLRERGEDGVGDYLVCDVAGPGAIVRGWSAAMGGTLRVYLDGAEKPIFEGPAYEFLARRSHHFFQGAGLELDCGDAFMQQDADYFPIPFSQRLRVTWEGKIDELHFYHLQVRLYEDDVNVCTFDPDKDLAGNVEHIYGVAHDITAPDNAYEGTAVAFTTSVASGATWEGPELPAGPMAVTELRLRVAGDDPDEALRGTLLRIAFDGASEPQVEAPLGDFFGTGPGVHPYSSLPMSVMPDGDMVCRFVMPYEKTARLELVNHTAADVEVAGEMTLSPWKWDNRSLHFRARWRVDHDLDLKGPIDMPYTVMRGQGRFVGMAVQVANPSPVPTPWGSWWGEGDEKIFIDGEPETVAFGTGSEDYFNYSWSRPDLFDHPYCGQPLNQGPGNAGYVSNHRWQVTDSIPFDTFLAVYMELWHHKPFPGVSYGRAAYVYARPGAVDDHRRLLAAELAIPEIPRLDFQPIYGAANATFHDFDLGKMVVEGECSIDAGRTSPFSGQMIALNARKDCKLRFRIPVEKAGKHGFNLVAAHCPESGTIRVLLDGKALKARNLGGAEGGRRGEEVVTLKSSHVHRRLSTEFEPLKLEAGDHEAAIEILNPGQYEFYYIWLKRHGD